MTTKPHLHEVTSKLAVTTARPELRFDPLAVDSLPPTAGLELDYRTKIQFPGASAKQTLYDLVWLVVVVALLTLAIRFLNTFVGGWWVASTVLSLCTIGALFAYLKFEPRELRIEVIFAAVTFGLFGFWLLAPGKPSPSLAALSLLVPVLLVTLLACRITVHYLHWMNANPHLTRQIRSYMHSTLCKRLLAFDFNPIYAERQAARLRPIAPDTKHTPKRPTPIELRKDAAVHRFAVLPPLFVLALATALCALPLSHGPRDWKLPDTSPEFSAALYRQVLSGITSLGIPVLGFMVTYLCLAIPRLASINKPPAPQARTRLERHFFAFPWFEPFLISWHAIVSYHTYNRHETYAPGVFQSPYGQWWQRRILSALAISTSCFAILPLTGYGSGPTPLASYCMVGASVPWSWEAPAARSESWQHTEARIARVVKHPEGYLAGIVRGIFLGRPIFFVLFPVMILSCVFWPLFFIMAIVGTVSAPVLTHAYKRLESPIGYQDPGRRFGTTWAAHVRRLQESPYETKDAFGVTVRERDHLLVGFNLLSDYPVLMHRDIPRGHMHLLGDTGSGKSALGMANLCNQLIGRPNTSMLILDLKGDPALFHGVYDEAWRAGVDFKWFTNRANCATYAFNPFLQEHFENVTPHQRTEMLLKALGLEYGEGYGPAFFAALNRHVLDAVFTARPNIRSFRELDQFFREEFPGIYKTLGISHRECEDAAHLYTVVHSLASFDALNIPRDDSSSVHQCRIDMAEVVREPQIVYFSLPASVEQKSVREIARLALHSLLTAASDRGPSKHEVFLVIDEFAQVVDSALEIVLQQARDMGISAILANQSLAQLKNKDTDLTPTISTNTRGRLIFAASDPQQQDALLKVAGHTAYSMNGWLQAARAYLSDMSVGELLASAASTPGGSSFPLDDVTAERLNRNDLIELSSHPLRCVAQFTRQAGFTCYGGYPFPIHAQFHITSEVYQERKNREWPENAEWTLVQRVSPPQLTSTWNNEPPPDNTGALASSLPVSPTMPPGKGESAPRREQRTKPRRSSGEQSLIRGIDAL